MHLEYIRIILSNKCRKIRFFIAFWKLFYIAPKYPYTDMGYFVEHYFAKQGWHNHVMGRLQLR